MEETGPPETPETQETETKGPPAETAAPPQVSPRISIEDFGKLELVIAVVTAVEPHPNADRLIKIQIDMGGGETRQIVAGIPRGRHAKWREARAVKYYWEKQLIYDKEGKRRRTPAVKVPNGPMADRYDRARNIPLYDASKLRPPALLIRGDHDRSSLDPEANGLFKALTASRGKRHVIIGDATHFIQYEKRREELYSEVQLFLEG